MRQRNTFRLAMRLEVTAAAMVLCASSIAGQELPVMPSTLSVGLLARLDESTSKLVQLAYAIPAERYDWRPTPEVRSVREVLIHVAMGNYYTAEDAGTEPPDDLPRDADRDVTGKDAVIAFVERANGHLRGSLQRLTDDDLRRSTTMFDQPTIFGNVYVFGIGHVQEHLGQLIAYARTIGVVPPWAGAP